MNDQLFCSVKQFFMGVSLGEQMKAPSIEKHIVSGIRMIAIKSWQEDGFSFGTLEAEIQFSIKNTVFRKKKCKGNF
jgi:hypothetical protein